MIDELTQTRMRLLVQDAAVAVYAFRKQGDFLLVPADADDFEPTVRDAMKQGATPVAVIALMNRLTAEGEALIEFELMPGASEDHARNAAALFKLNLMGAGILKMDTAQG